MQYSTLDPKGSPAAEKVDVLKPYRGGEELRRAAAVLAGPSGGSRSSQQGADGAAADHSAPPPPIALPPPPVALPPNADAGTRELAMAAQRYAAAAAANAGDYEAVYNHGLALQELASRAGAQTPQQYQLLGQACERYEAACALRQTSHGAFYNWGVALSDLARHVRATDAEASELFLLQSAEKYGQSLRWNPNNPQALNNWALVLQELTGLRPPSERAFLVAAAAAKFRRAIRLRPEFDRACYNLGTVYYSHAMALQTEAGKAGGQDASAAAASPAGQPSQQQQERRPGGQERQQAATRQPFELAAQYIALAHTLQPGKDIYKRSLQVVRQMLPLPFLRVGHLLVVDDSSEQQPAVDERWQRAWFILDAESLRAAPDPQRQPAGSQPAVTFNVQPTDIRAAKVAADPSLPPGAALWLSLNSRPQGVYLVSSSKEDAEGWVDALHLVAHLAAAARLATLQQTLCPQSLSGTAQQGT